ncbi:MAG TPA: hypothetical protein VH088_07815 [Terriglobales bacterium]|jgi:hypothetical protein|nr:hypothetical protein [Terriglobales bacterium]
MAAENAIQEEQSQQPPVKTARERSTIEFPYGDLNDALEVARGVRHLGGSGCEWEQLAAQLNQAANGGGFRQKMITAKLFGAVTYSTGKVSLSALGARLCDPQQERIAKADAFLSVPLYRAVYDKYKGNTLPPPNGLEGEMVSLGVSFKQKDKARQYFQRSAAQADFFWSGQDRLVMPVAGNHQKPPASHHEDPPPKPKGDGGSGDGGDYHPFIQGLLKTLPKNPEDLWPLEKQAKWLQTASGFFDLIYTRDADGRSIKVSITKDAE